MVEYGLAFEFDAGEVGLALEFDAGEVGLALEFDAGEVGLALEFGIVENGITQEFGRDGGDCRILESIEVSLAFEFGAGEVGLCELGTGEPGVTREFGTDEINPHLEFGATEVGCVRELDTGETTDVCELGEAKVGLPFEYAIRKVCHLMEFRPMEIEIAITPKLVAPDLLPYHHVVLISRPLFQMGDEHTEDGGFHGLVGIAGPGKTRRRLAVRTEGIRLAIGPQIAAQDVHHALTISTLVSVRDVRQRVDARDARGGLVGAQLVDGGTDLLVCDAGRLALLGPVLDDQICDATDSRDGRQGALNGLEGPVVLIRAGTGFGSAADARARCRTGRRPSTPPFHQHGQQSCRENDPYGDRHEQRELPHPFLRRPPEQPQNDGKHEDTQTQQ